MKDLTSAAWIKLKAALFVVIGLSAATLLFFEAPSAKTAGLLMLTVWGFCRAYYFAFYVIEHYVDPSYKFSGLGSFLAYLVRRKKRQP